MQKPQDQPELPRVCVVGTGALGSALLDLLRQHGVASVLLVDPDAAEKRNLELSPLLRRAVAQPIASAERGSSNKADLLALAARTVDGLPWRSAACEIADVGWMELDQIDLFCCCTDSVLSRAETSWIARALGRPLLDGGVFGQGIAAGRVTTFLPQAASPCVVCGLSQGRRAAVLGYAASTSLGCQVPESVPAMSGALAALEAVAKAMLAKIHAWQSLPPAAADTLRLAQAADGSWQHEQHLLQRSATCPWHEQPTATLTTLPWNDPLNQTLREGEELVLNWPVCTEASCEACGARSGPMQRVARVRRAACLACGETRATAAASDSPHSERRCKQRVLSAAAWNARPASLLVARPCQPTPL